MKLFIPLALLMLAGCGDPVGSRCEIVGSGFHAKDNCASKCLSRWQVTCPDGRSIQPGVCAGQQACSPGGCPQGQACYSFADPFEAISYCVPSNICGDGVSPHGLRAWENRSAQTALKARMGYRKSSPSSQKPVTQPAPE